MPAMIRAPNYIKSQPKSSVGFLGGFCQIYLRITINPKPPCSSSCNFTSRSFAALENLQSLSTRFEDCVWRCSGGSRAICYFFNLFYCVNMFRFGLVMFNWLSLCGLFVACQGFGFLYSSDFYLVPWIIRLLRFLPNIGLDLDSVLVQPLACFFFQ